MKTLQPIAHLAELIRARFGLDFAGMRQPVLADGLARVDPDPEAAALEVIRADRERFADFVGTLTNSETYFFRHAEQFAALGALLRRQWLARPPATYRAWCAGCATGEEPVTLSAVVEEASSGVTARPLVTILATDINPDALRLAQKATYASEWSFRGVLPEQRSRHFVREGGGFRPQPALRERINFVRHNVLDPAPEAALFDLVVCRNVLIYFDARSFEQAIHRLALAVAPGGLLVLGPVESAAAKLPDFDVLQPGSCVLFQKRSAAPAVSWSSSAPPRPRPSRPAWVATPAPLAPTLSPAGPAALAAAPSPLAERLAHAHALADQGHLTQARALIASLRRAHGDLGELRILDALLHLESGDRDAAAAELEAALAADAHLAMAHYLLGLILEGAGAHAQAEGWYRRALHVLGDADPGAVVPGGGGMTVADLTSTLTHSLRLSPEVTP